MNRPLSDLTIVIKGAGEMASGIACRLRSANFRKIIMLDIRNPRAVRREVSFCEAIHDIEKSVEGITARQVDRLEHAAGLWRNGYIAVYVGASGDAIRKLQSDVLVDAIVAKRNTGTSMEDAGLVIALGPGFQAGRDAHMLVETNRGHNLGRIIIEGETEPNTGIPGAINNVTVQRVLRAPIAGFFKNEKRIGDLIEQGEIVAYVERTPVFAEIDGVIRGLIRPGIQVTQGMKIGDIDPRGEKKYCYTVSEKARAIGGSVLEAILRRYNR